MISVDMLCRELTEAEMMNLSKQDCSAANDPEDTVLEDGHPEPIDVTSLIEGLPDSVALQCLARVPLHCHPALRRISRAWRSALQSPELFRTRKLAGVEEEWLYASAYEPDKVWQAYDPIFDCWSTLPVLPSCIKHLANFGTASVEGKLYVVGGGSDEVDPQTRDRNETTATNEVWRFDPITGKWEQRAPMITSRSQFACCVLDDHIVAAGGFTNTRKALALAEMYNPVLDKWESLPGLAQVHNAACSGIVFEEKVHVVHKGTSQAQVYDAKDNRWARRSHGNEIVAGAPKMTSQSNRRFLHRKIYVFEFYFFFQSYRIYE